MIDNFKDYMSKNPPTAFDDKPIDRFSTESLSPFFDESGALTKNLDVTVTGDPAFREVFILSATAKYESNKNGDFPAVQIRLINRQGITLYYSPVYEIGHKREFYRREWRIPPIIDCYDTVRLSFIIPEGVRLMLRDIRVKANTRYRERDIGIRYHAHCGIPGYAASDTVFSWQMAGELGFTSCITIPKFTIDGIPVCFHDDTSVINMLRKPDGSALEAGSHYDKPISEYTYEELQELDMGLRKDRIYAGSKVAKMEDFFRICSMTGMQPIFSVHPSLTREQWLCVRELLEKYRLLEHFWIKAGNPATQTICAEVFDNSIAGYILIQGAALDWDPDERVIECGFDKNRHNIVIEFFNFAATEEKIKRARDEGYRVSVACMKGGTSGPLMNRMIDLGVSEFTIDHHCSMGLDW